MNVNVPMIEVGMATAEMSVLREVAQEEEDHQHREQAAEDQVELHLADRVLDELDVSSAIIIV